MLGSSGVGVSTTGNGAEAEMGWEEVAAAPWGEGPRRPARRRSAAATAARVAIGFLCKKQS